MAYRSIGPDNQQQILAIEAHAKARYDDIWRRRNLATIAKFLLSAATVAMYAIGLSAWSEGHAISASLTCFAATCVWAGEKRMVRFVYGQIATSVAVEWWIIMNDAIVARMQLLRGANAEDDVARLKAGAARVDALERAALAGQLPRYFLDHLPIDA